MRVYSTLIWLQNDFMVSHGGLGHLPKVLRAARYADVVAVIF